MTIGVACNPPVISPGWWIHATLSFLTFVLLMLSSALNRLDLPLP